ncbi:MAG: hypothetical protein IJV98_08435 [Clostridia bacterium]|nr:hypothetical protein [Clostridia bacterium]
MMKRILMLGLILAMLSGVACDREPVYINTATTTTDFCILDQGVAVVDTRYMGYRGQTEGATVSVTVELLDEHGRFRSVISETYSAEGYYHVEQRRYRIERLGTYRLIVTYLVSGVDGSTDTVTTTREYTISEGAVCPRGSGIAFCVLDPVPDCAAPVVCLRCGQTPEDMRQTVRIMQSMGGVIADRDETYHYKQCFHTTALGVPCTAHGREEHIYSDGVCTVCQYARTRLSRRTEVSE